MSDLKPLKKKIENPKRNEIMMPKFHSRGPTFLIFLKI